MILRRREPAEVVRVYDQDLEETQTLCRDYRPHLTWERVRTLQEELESLAGEREVWDTLLSCCHHNPTPDKQKKMDGQKM